MALEVFAKVAKNHGLDASALSEKGACTWSFEDNLSVEITNKNEFFLMSSDIVGLDRDKQSQLDQIKQVLATSMALIRETRTLPHLDKENNKLTLIQKLEPRALTVRDLEAAIERYLAVLEVYRAKVGKPR